MNRGDVIFFRNNGVLQAFGRADYTSEDLLQRLLELHPDLLSGEQLRPGDPIRWLFVAREAGVPDGESSGDRWSLDHLFLDQDATPTLVEVKRSSDTRIRREVVGQMLDYAANASLRWPRGRIRELAARHYGSEQEINAALARLKQVGELEPDQVETYWREVDDNLAAGRLRLLFVADHIPNELRRVIEFLNTHMPAMEVLGVEIAQYLGGGAEAFVPRVVGQTQAARDTKQAPRTQATAQTFLDAMPDEYRPMFEDLLRRGEERGLTTSWNTRGFSFRMMIDGKLTSLFYGFPPGASGLEHPSMTAYLGHLAPERRQAVRERFMAAPFTQGGNYSLNLLLEPGNLEIAAIAMKALWDVVDQLQDAALPE
jgi:hypothetical protein